MSCASEPTKKECVRNVRKCAEHFEGDPARLTENQVRHCGWLSKRVGELTPTAWKASQAR